MTCLSKSEIDGQCLYIWSRRCGKPCTWWSSLFCTNKRLGTTVATIVFIAAIIGGTFLFR